MALEVPILGKLHSTIWIAAQVLLWPELVNFEPVTVQILVRPERAVARVEIAEERRFCRVKSHVVGQRPFSLKDLVTFLTPERRYDIVLDEIGSCHNRCRVRIRFPAAAVAGRQIDAQLVKVSAAVGVAVIRSTLVTLLQVPLANVCLHDAQKLELLTADMARPSLLLTTAHSFMFVELIALVENAALLA